MKLEEFLTVEGDDSKHLSDGRVAATWDSLGRCWNIGPGLTIGVTRNTVWTQNELKAHELAEFAAVKAGVDHLVHVPLTENQTTVLQSFAYNCGLGALASSSILRSVNSGHFSEVPAELRLYVHAKGASGPVPGLISRRAAEIRLWNKPDSTPAEHLDTAPASAPPAVTQEQVPWSTILTSGLALLGAALLVRPAIRAIPST